MVVCIHQIGIVFESRKIDVGVCSLSERITRNHQVNAVA